MADTLGYTATNTWNFTLESQPQVVSNLFVFGSPQAQRAGQQVGNIPTAALARRFGPIPMSAGDSWTLELVASNRLELSYTNTAPGFATNTYVCNLTPARPADIFNRRITGISDDPGNKRLTLFTVEVPLTEIATTGSASVSGDSVMLETGTNGAFMKSFSIGNTVTFHRIGYSLDGAEFKLKDSVGGFDLVNLTLEEEHWWLTPRLQVALEVNWGELQRFEAIASGNIESASVWDVDFLLAGLAIEKTLFDLPEPLEPKTWMYLGAIGPVPVYASLGFDVKLKARAETHATLNFRAGKRETADAAFGLSYTKPDVQWVNTFNFPPPEVVPFTANINAEGSLKVSLEPTLEFLVYGLAGVSAGITPSAGVAFEVGTGQPLSGRMEADVSLDLGLAGPAFDWLNPTPELSLPLWHDEWHLFPNTAAIAFTTQPESQTRSLGASAYFSCAVSATGTPSYQWFANSVPMSDQTSRTLLIPSVTYGHAGKYQVRVAAGGQIANSTPATLTVLPPTLQVTNAINFGMVAYYPFDGNIFDASGHTRHAAAQGIVSFEPGMVGQAASFSMSWIQIPNVLNELQSFSISLWVNERGMTNGGPGDGEGGGEAYISFGDHDAGWAGIAAWGGDWAGVGASNVAIVAPVSTSGFNSGQIDFVKSKIEWRNRWHHCVVTYDSAGSVRSLFIDGVLINQKPASKPILMGLGAIASHTWYYGVSRAFRLLGLIDEIRIYDRTLSASEVQQLHNLSLPAGSTGMALIPGGNFTMGDTFNEGLSDELPVHDVYVSAFYMDRYEVTKALWDDVYNWAVTHGYSFDNGGSGKAANHPVHTVNWYDAVKWCNARSEKEGKTPAYYADVELSVRYRTGQMAPYVNWSSGYRLPTEAEWEKAARGGASGHRFPWANVDTITHSQANYYSDNFGYDISPTRGYHPTFNDGVDPYTSPVGYFAPNGYGLYDMAGNVWEWCWDWYGGAYYNSSPATDPCGPSSGAYRVLRGGSWFSSTNHDRCAYRVSDWISQYVPAYADVRLGFRSVLPPGQ